MYIAVAGNGTGRRYELRRTVKGPHGLAAERLLDEVLTGPVHEFRHHYSF